MDEISKAILMEVIISKVWLLLSVNVLVRTGLTLDLSSEGIK